MVTPDGSAVVAVNGEIYNYRELKKQLYGSEFRSRSDSEVVLHGFQAWGLHELLERLEGMYAIALFDAQRNEIHLIRDRVGIKPLYFGECSEGVVWASELKAIVDFMVPSPSIDESAAYDALIYGYVPAPKTIYRRIHKLEPGCALTIDCSTLSMRHHRYWSLPIEPVERSVEQESETLRDLIDESVNSHLMSDVPVGFFLSGGLDSSIVLWHASRGRSRLAAYTIGYDDAEHDETGFARDMAKSVDADHEVSVLTADVAEDVLSIMHGWFDEPFGDTSALPTHHVSALARRRSIVALSGDGGDELFGGYRWYRRISKLRARQRVVMPLLRAVGPTSLATGRPAGGWADRLRSAADQMTRTDPIALHAFLLGDRMRADQKALWRSDLGLESSHDDHWYFREHDDPSLAGSIRWQSLDFKTYLPDDILTKVDRTSMAVSLEVRVPLLARSLVEFAFSLPPPETQTVLKPALKAAYASVLPHELLQRPKRGFSIPLGSWRERVLEGSASSVVEALVVRMLT